MISESNRFSRQTELVPLEPLQSLRITIVGVGAIGRQIAIQAAALGARRVQLVDFDVIEPSNLTTQGFRRSEISATKVEATRSAMLEMDPSIEIETVTDRFRPSLQTGEVIFCCVDKISVREAIWRAVGDICRFWSDGRMLGESLRILSAADTSGRDYYPTTLFTQAEAEVGRCTAHGTIYVAAIAAGLMLHQFCRWLRSQPIDRDLSLNLTASELVAISAI